jgi:hypothetical protein
MTIDEATRGENALSDSGPVRPATMAKVIEFDVRGFHAGSANDRLRRNQTYTGRQHQNSGRAIKSWMKAAKFR